MLYFHLQSNNGFFVPYCSPLARSVGDMPILVIIINKYQVIELQSALVAESALTVQFFEIFRASY